MQKSYSQQNDHMCHEACALHQAPIWGDTGGDWSHSSCQTALDFTIYAPRDGDILNVYKGLICVDIVPDVALQLSLSKRHREPIYVLISPQ